MGLNAKTTADFGSLIPLHLQKKNPRMVMS